MALPTLTGRTAATLAATPLLLLLANCGDGSDALPQLAAARPAALSDSCESLPAS